jgi:hypothetical protein
MGGRLVAMAEGEDPIGMNKVVSQGGTEICGLGRLSG